MLPLGDHKARPYDAGCENDEKIQAKEVGMSNLCWWKAIFFLCVLCVGAIGSPGQTFKTLANFDRTVGGNPYAALVQATDGNLYGTTYTGGAYGDGTVFKITTGGALTPLHSFDGTDGAGPRAGLVLATDGDLYGTTVSGGAYSCTIGACGTVFNITTGDALVWVQSFDGTDGAYPHAGLVQATDGNFYGTTSFGGAYAGGTFFKITPGGTLTTLYSFGYSEGVYPNGGLVQATDGNFYGTTFADQPGNGLGTVFKITTGGVLTQLHFFDGTDGANPLAGLVQATNGNLYGTTYHGGAYGDGTVFKITPGGTLTPLHSFDGADGANPQAGLVQGTDGNLYGTTDTGGAYGDGTLFKITTGGTLSTLHSLDGTDGANPYAGLVQATNGTLYGTTYDGGASGDGTVFSLSVGLSPFVEPLTYSGKVGSTIEFLGQGFTSSTTVCFNGKAAIRKVVSGTYLTATVPSGATTSFVTVTTSGGTLKSNKIFRVIPQITTFSPTRGPVGKSVTITGESLTGATSVTFHGVEAKFTLDSYTQITATVPAGAKTGKIDVTTPGGTATSTGTFTVN